MQIKESDSIFVDALTLMFLYYKPKLLQRLDHFDRKIILILMKSSSSASAIAEILSLNRKTVRVRLKKLKRLDIVTERPSRNSMFSLSDGFVEILTKATRIVVERKIPIDYPSIE